MVISSTSHSSALRPSTRGNSANPSGIDGSGHSQNEDTLLLSPPSLGSTLESKLKNAAQARNDAARRAERYRATAHKAEKKASLYRKVALAGAGIATAGLLTAGTGNFGLGLSLFGGGAAVGIHSIFSSTLHQSTADMNYHFVGLAEENEIKALVEESRLNAALKNSADLS